MTVVAHRSAFAVRAVLEEGETPQQPMRAAQAASPAAVQAAAVHPSQAAPQAQAEQEGRAS
jgi:hypothetical protein